jgi:hypothetical protein
MTSAWDDTPIDRQIQHFLTEMGWNWSQPRLASWIQRCGFSHPALMTDKCRMSLVKFLFEMQTVTRLMVARGLGDTYLTSWMTKRGYQGSMPLKGYITLRTELEALEDEILF